MSNFNISAEAIKAAIKKSGIDQILIEEAFIGNVVSAGIGQVAYYKFPYQFSKAPARQAVIYAGLKLDTPSTTGSTL